MLEHQSVFFFHKPKKKQHCIYGTSCEDVKYTVYLSDVHIGYCACVRVHMRESVCALRMCARERGEIHFSEGLTSHVQTWC